MTAIIQTEGLSKSYGGERAVDALDLTINRGQSVGLLGPNGAGKSTAINMLLGLLEPSSGSASVLGLDPARDGPAIRRRVGYVPERHHIYGWMTVAEVLGFTGSFYPTWNDGLCEQLRERYALPPDRKVRELSHGMGTKLSLILALAHEPELLVLDEPTTGLDPIARREFVEEVAELLANEDKTVLFSSHILSDVERIADTIAIVNAGKLLTLQPREQLLHSTKRVHIERGELEVPPDIEVVSRTREDGCWSLTVANFSGDTLGQLERAFGADAVRVSDMPLDDILHDFVAGNRTA